MTMPTSPRWRRSWPETFPMKPRCPRTAPDNRRWPSSAWPAVCRAPTAPRLWRHCSSAARMPSPGATPPTGTVRPLLKTGTGLSGVVFWTTSALSMPLCSVSLPAKPWRSIPSSACCWKSPGRPWSGPGSRRTACAAAAQASSRASALPITRTAVSSAARASTPMWGRETPTASRPTAFPISTGSKARAWP